MISFTDQVDPEPERTTKLEFPGLIVEIVPAPVAFVSGYWILEGKTPVRVSFPFWAQWIQNAGNARLVALSELDGVRVSTAFIGVGKALFETKIFGGTQGGRQWRADTWEQAEANHHGACEVAWPQPSKSEK